jgi:glycosyltransferase involved in cell wall biosynthesis
VYGRAVKWSTGLMPCGIRGAELFAKYGGESKPQFAFPFIPDTRKFAQPNRADIARLKHRFDFEPDRRRIIFSARLMPAKRPDLAIEAFQAIADERPDWDLVMVGDGKLRASLEGHLSPKFRSRVTWTGFLHSVDEMAAMYALGDVLLLPSDHEPWGVVVAEAAAAGMAIVASDAVGAAPEQVQNDRNGFQFASGNLAQLSEALRRGTAVDWINGGKQQSPAVLREWMQNADPVAGLRDALMSCRLIEKSRPHESHRERQNTKSSPA